MICVNLYRELMGLRDVLDPCYTPLSGAQIAVLLEGKLIH